MRQSKQFFMGIDVSKPWFDLALMVISNGKKSTIITERFANTPAGIKTLLHWLQQHKVSFDKNSLLVIENTGIYHRLLWQFCSKQQLPIHIGNAAHIKWSLGITRGKTDKIDCTRLCQYASRHYDELKVALALNPVLMRLKDLMTARTNLVKQLHGMKNYLRELKSGHDQSLVQLMEKIHRQALEGIKKSIKAIETQIEKIITEDKKLHRNYQLIKSVPGIGHLTAVYIICCTDNFLVKRTGKQLASYAGVVPYDHISGISIKGRPRVHKMANKDLKKMLHLCALTAIKYYPEFRDYYNRKKAEGKNGMSVLNAIRNKLMLRVVAVVNNQKPYVEYLQQTA